jgi:hypothetical protein
VFCFPLRAGIADEADAGADRMAAGHAAYVVEVEDETMFICSINNLLAGLRHQTPKTKPAEHGLELAVLDRSPEDIEHPLR